MAKAEQKLFVTRGWNDVMASAYIAVMPDIDLVTRTFLAMSQG
ncbi:hypothetical protein [Pseudosulfitobacter pseudonitzschiae]|nr:hypothetical protein [Pseudosulfitobacter pseudonitzschiae]